MHHLKEIVFSYIETDAANNHALMIDGKWGSGKTHYFKEIIAKEFKKVEEKKLLYVSLNGLQSTSEIFDELIAEKFKFVGFLQKTTAGKITYGAVRSVLNIGINAVSFGLNIKGEKKEINPQTKDLHNIAFQELVRFSKDKHVICFDDLERIGKKLDVVDVLGFINRNFVEHEGIKVIIICDETRIDKNKQQSGSKEREYDTVKEKVVGRTIKFAPQINQIFPDLISVYREKDEAYYDFLVSHEEYLLEKILLTSEENIRTIFFMLDNLWMFFKSLGEEEKGLNEPIKKMILAIITFSFEEKASNLIQYENIDQLPSIFTERHHPGTTLIFRETEDIIRRIVDPSSGGGIKIEKDEVQSELAEKRKNLTHKYWGNDPYEFFPSVFEYIKTGYLNGEKLTHEIRNLIPEELPDHEQTLNKISRPYELNDDDFNSLYPRLIEDIKKDKHSLKDLVEAAKILYDLEATNISASLSKNDLDQLFSKAIQKAKGKTPYEEIPIIGRLMSARTHGFDKATELIAEFNKALRLLNNERKELEINENLQKIREEKSPKIEIGEFKEIISFHSSKEIIEVIKEKFDRRPSEISTVRDFFELTYLTGPSDEEIIVNQKEAENLKALHLWSKELLSSINETEKPMSFIWARSLFFKLEKIVNNMKVA